MDINFVNSRGYNKSFSDSCDNNIIIIIKIFTLILQIYTEQYLVHSSGKAYKHSNYYKTINVDMWKALLWQKLMQI